MKYVEIGPRRVFATDTFPYERTLEVIRLKDVHPSDVPLEGSKPIKLVFDCVCPEIEWFTPLRHKLGTIMVRQARARQTRLNRLRFGLQLKLIRYGVI